LFGTRVGFGSSWLCKNPQTLNRDRRNYSSKTALVALLASKFNLEAELKNIILVAFRFFEFSHSQGHVWTAPWQELSDFLQYWSDAVTCPAC
jgi:hypothetical protein